MRAFALAALLAALGVTHGCAGTASEVRAALAAGKVADALAVYGRGSPPDRSALREIAGAVLEREARGPGAPAREAAFAALTASGTYARAVLERLASADDPGVRARALALLTRLGDPHARYALTEYADGADPDARAAAVEALDPTHDRARLAALAEWPAGEVRLAAIRALARAEPNDAMRILFARAALHDPLASVRAAALGALARRGSAAFDAIETCLADADASVRASAIAALVYADRARATRTLDRWVATDPSAEGIEAARMLLLGRGEAAMPAARAHLERALASSNERLRAQAAVALASLDPAFAAPLAAAGLAHEPIRAVKLWLALALGRDDAHARNVLRVLMTGTDVVAAQAAAELARRGDAAAVEKLLAFRSNASTAVRRTVVRVLAHDLGHTHEVRLALLDADASVRIAAAAAILAGTG